MSKINLKRSYFNPVTGESYVVISYKGEEYAGYAHLHSDDKEHASEIVGCKYAEIRATIKALKAEYKEKKAAYEECEKFINAIKNYAVFDSADGSARAMYRQLNRRKIEVDNIKMAISTLEDVLCRTIVEQDAFNKRMDKFIKAKND